MKKIFTLMLCMVLTVGLMLPFIALADETTSGSAAVYVAAPQSAVSTANSTTDGQSNDITENTTGESSESTTGESSESVADEQSKSTIGESSDSTTGEQSDSTADSTTDESPDDTAGNTTDNTVDNTTVYGDDTNGDGSKGNPYATIAKAYEKVGDGGTIYLLSDISITWTFSSGQSVILFNKNKSITITSYGNKRTISSNCKIPENPRKS